MSKKLKKISMQDIAERLDISKNAVSLALNGKAGVSEETRNIVIQMAKRMNYAGFDSKTSKSNKLLVLIPEYIRHDSYFYNEVYWSIESHAKNKGYTAILTSVSDEMQEDNQIPSIFSDIDFLGIITVGVLSASYVEFLCTLTSNIVSVDQCYYELEIDSVVTDNLQGSYNLTEYLIKQGHKKIGFVGPIMMTTSIFERWSGYQQAMLHHGLEVDEKLSILSSSPLKSLLSERAELYEKLAQLKELPTAWICGGDRIAISLIENLNSMGYQVPKDISVAGFDNIEASEIVNPPLTTVEVERNILGTTAVDVLIKNAFQKKNKTKTAIHTSLVIRNSVGEI